MKLEAKKLQNIFKSNLKKRLRGRFKSEEQKSAFEYIKFLYKSRELLLNCLIIIIQLYLRLNTKQKTKKD